MIERLIPAMRRASDAEHRLDRAVIRATRIESAARRAGLLETIVDSYRRPPIR